MVSVALFCGCQDQSLPESTQAATGRAADETKFQTPKWSIEWFYFADFQCLGEASSKTEFMEELLLMENSDLGFLLSDGKALFDKARPLVNSLVAENRIDLAPLSADIEWSTALPEDMTLELRSRGEGIPDDEWYVFTPDGAYLLWPFNISGRRPGLQSRWDKKIDSMISGGHFTLPKEIIRNTENQTLGSTLAIIDAALEHEEHNFRRSFRMCAPDNASSRANNADRLACIDKSLVAAELPPIEKRSRLSISVDDTQPMVNTRLIAGLAGSLQLQIGTKPMRTDTTRFKVPVWPCGRLVTNE